MAGTTNGALAICAPAPTTPGYGGGGGVEPDFNTLLMAIATLYSDSPQIPANSKHEASSYLDSFQKSVYAWSLADKLLYEGKDLATRSFGAHTLRTKIQNSFGELPREAHISLRDSLLQHIRNITPSTERAVVKQLCIAVAQLLIQATSWADPISQLIHTFAGNPAHWYPLLEILTLIPEEMYSRKIKLGENRRTIIANQLGGASPVVLNFIKQCLASCLNGSLSNTGIPVDTINLLKSNILYSFKSWVSVSPEIFCSGSGDILSFTVDQLREGNCGEYLHTAAMNCICSVFSIIPELETSGNNNGTDANNLQLALFNAVMSFENAYHMSVAKEDHDKTQNYSRIFSEYPEVILTQIQKKSVQPEYLPALNLVLICVGHHEYEIAELTFSFWYDLADELFHVHDESLNSVFRPYVLRFVQALFKHCQIEPDHEGPLDSDDDFYEFRKKCAELVEDLLFVLNGGEVFTNLTADFIQNDSNWMTQEAALFLLFSVSKLLNLSTNADLVEPVVAHILNKQVWMHVCSRITATRFIGGMGEFLSTRPEPYLLQALTFLAASLEIKEISNIAGAAIENVCEKCASQIAPVHLESLLCLLKYMDQRDISNEAVIGLLRGIGHVVGRLPNDKLSQTVREICWSQLGPLNELIQRTDIPNGMVKGTKTDPTFWLDRLAGLFRDVTFSQKGTNHPCQQAICEDMWPVVSRLCEKYQADARIMERVCRCLRYAVRCVGKDSFPLLQPLVFQLVALYSNHPHSSFLYLGSILVDEYGGEASCNEGLLSMLGSFFITTNQLLGTADGLRSNPDTVDDFFRLCARFLQRCPIPFLKAPILPSLIQFALQGMSLDHREANASVLKFLYELIHCGRRTSENEQDLIQIRYLLRNVILQHGELISTCSVRAIVFELRTPLLFNVCEFIFELKEFMPHEFSAWLELALKKLPSENPSGGAPYATLDQIANIHKEILGSRGAKEMSRYVKDFCRLYR